MNLSATTVIIACFVAFSIPPGTSYAMSDDEAKIETLENAFVAAFNAKDVDAIMKVYVPDASLVVFDVVPPRQYLGADAYRKDWQDYFAMLKGPVKFWITDLHVETAGTLGYSHSIQHVSGTDAKGQPIELVVRVTDGYRKVDGNWLIAHEHVSVPVDVTTAKPDLMSKP
jgi:ketosteroid isomerase-like protein